MMTTCLGQIESYVWTSMMCYNEVEDRKKRDIKKRMTAQNNFIDTLTKNLENIHQNNISIKSQP